MTIVTRFDSIVYNFSTVMLHLWLFDAVLIIKGERCISFEKKLHKYLHKDVIHANVATQPAFTCSKSAMETPEQ